ncbi:MAG: SH3 domain-containing protein [Defluviitaleaceae bacterium]|nr:SH3 domain-containing protein [Defluviitaleaceae bacterium]
MDRYKRPDDGRHNRDENRAILKKVNRISKGRKKAGIDGVKIIVIMVSLMAVIAAFLIFIGNMDFPQPGGRTQENGYEGEIPQPSIVPFDPPEEDLTPFIPPDISEDMLFYPDEGGRLELPVIGATGWVASASALRDASGGAGAQIRVLPAGQAFTILAESGDWWQVRLPDGETVGWVDHRRCWINLPDVLPSIIYNISNADRSLFRSSGFMLDGITDMRLYSAKAFNERLGREEFIVPGMYPMARALHTVQQIALGRGDTLVIYEVYRPRSTQQSVVDAMNVLMRNNIMANTAISDSPWTLSWFISTGVSNHQRAAAVDTSLARVHDTEILQAGDYSYLRITNYTLIDTGTRMHELSPASAIVNRPIGITASQILGGNLDLTGAAVTTGIVRMQFYFASAGFNPLASEWWHFDHHPSITMATAANINGDFYTPTVYSEPPIR